MTNQQRRTARGATRRRPAPGPRRRIAQSHDRVSSRSRAGTSRTSKNTSPRIPVNRSAPRRSAEPTSPRPLLRTLTKIAARAVLGVVILAIFVFGVFPTGSYVDQRSELNDAEQELVELQAENEQLEQRVERLESDDAIENKARADYGLERPEDESYLILPPGQ